jgi:hypothetical protein
LNADWADLADSRGSEYLKLTLKRFLSVFIRQIRQIRVQKKSDHLSTPESTEDFDF